MAESKLNMRQRFISHNYTPGLKRRQRCQAYREDLTSLGYKGVVELIASGFP